MNSSVFVTQFQFQTLPVKIFKNGFRCDFGSHLSFAFEIDDFIDDSVVFSLELIFAKIDHSHTRQMNLIDRRFRSFLRILMKIMNLVSILAI